MKKHKKNKSKRKATESRLHTPSNPVKREVKVKTVEDRLCWKLVGVALLSFAVFAALALATYDWESVPALCENPHPTTNLIGVIGNSFAHAGYTAFGLAIWCLPFAFVIGGLKLLEPIPKDVAEVPNGRVVLRICGLMLMTLAITGLFQLSGRWMWVRNLMETLHAGRNAGGWVGYAFMTLGLEKGVAAFGAAFLSVGLVFVSLCMALGLKTVLKLFDWRLPDLSGFLGETAEAVGSGASRIKERMRAEGGEQPLDAPASRILRPTGQPAPKFKFPANAVLPPLTLLDPAKPKDVVEDDAKAMGEELMRKLRVFGVNATLSYTVVGPTVTQFAIKPGEGVRVDRITGLSRDLQLALKVKSLRVFAPIPGEDAVGIQVSNNRPQSVFFREVVESELWQRDATWPRKGNPKIPVPLLLGKDVKGEPVVADLTKMPHLLVAGASGKGKSVCLNAIINGFLMCRTPEQLRLILVDPKRMEFSNYAKLPHLLVPVVVEVKKVVGALRWAAKEMDERLKRFSEVGARNIIEFNETSAEKAPYIVIVIDEVGDVMSLCGRDVEPVLGRLMALARATGIHLILATQRPDVKTISGTIKANIPGRVAFATFTAADSRTILDETGAELLIGNGDMLYKTNDGLVRAQGAWVGKGEMGRIMGFVVKQWPSLIDESVMGEIEKENEDPGSSVDGNDGIDDEKYERAKRIVIDANRASISLIQRELRIGYNPASRIIERMEKEGVVGPARGAGPREILVSTC